jgi:hypothetical protein
MLRGRSIVAGTAPGTAFWTRVSGEYSASWGKSSGAFSDTDHSWLGGSPGRGRPGAALAGPLAGSGAPRREIRWTIRGQAKRHHVCCQSLVTMYVDSESSACEARMRRCE